MKINSITCKKYLAMVIRRLTRFWYDEQGDWIQGQLFIGLAIVIVASILRLMWHDTTDGVFGSFVFGLKIGLKCLFLSLSVHYSGWEMYQGIKWLVKWAKEQKL